MLQKILCGFFNIECIQKRFFDLWLVGCLWLLSVMVKFCVSLARLWCPAVWSKTSLGVVVKACHPCVNIYNPLWRSWRYESFNDFYDRFWYSVLLSLWTLCACSTTQTGLGFSWSGGLDAGESVMLAFFFLLVLSVLREDFSNIARHLLRVSLLERLYQYVHFVALHTRFYLTALYFSHNVFWNFTYLFCGCPGSSWSRRFSLAAVGGLPLHCGCRLLAGVACLVAEHGR